MAVPLSDPGPFPCPTLVRSLVRPWSVPVCLRILSRACTFIYLHLCFHGSLIDSSVCLSVRTIDWCFIIIRHHHLNVLGLDVLVCSSFFSPSLHSHSPSHPQARAELTAASERAAGLESRMATAAGTLALLREQMAAQEDKLADSCEQLRRLKVRLCLNSRELVSSGPLSVPSETPSVFSPL